MLDELIKSGKEIVAFVCKFEQIVMMNGIQTQTTSRVNETFTIKFVYSFFDLFNLIPTKNQQPQINFIRVDLA